MTTEPSSDGRTLKQLSDAATPGPWVAVVGSGPKRRKQQIAVLGVASMRGQGEAGALAVFAGIHSNRADDAELCAALVNAYREGRLVDAPPKQTCTHGNSPHCYPFCYEPDPSSITETPK